MGQVSLPVLSRKGKHDYWNYNWISFNNYSMNFNEDLFLKKFFFLFFMYGISGNKAFLPLFFKNTVFRSKNSVATKYSLDEFSFANIVSFLKKSPHNKYFTSKIFICKYLNWVYIYLYIYSITNLRVKVQSTRKQIHNYNKHMFYQTYLLSKNNYFLKKY